MRKNLLLCCLILGTVIGILGCGDKAEILEGYIIDKHCYDIKEPSEETVMCLQMEECEKRGYGVAVVDNNGNKFVEFDKEGHEKAKEFITENNNKEKLGKVIIKGKHKDETFSVEEIELEKK